MLQIRTQVAPIYVPEADVPLPDLTPIRAHDTDAAYDLKAAERIDIAPGDRALVRTGVTMAIPPGYCGLILPRSGLAIKHGITVLNAPGLIDPGYRGEVQVPLVHLGLRQRQHESAHGWRSYRVEPFFNIHPGDRIAQLLIVRFESANFHNAVELDNTDRGGNGFGSTGI